jgi:hypothetical protein
MGRFFYTIILLNVVITVSAQLPTSNIYLCNFEFNQNSLEISNIKFLTNFNAQGYNNQPYFLEKDRLFITSNYLQEDQTDIFQLNIEGENLLQVTDTDQSEYSPTPCPDGKHFSVIRVEPTRNNAQYLWQYPIDRKNGGFYLFENLSTVGYHCWLNQEKLAMFLVGDPYHELVIGDIETQKLETLVDNIGRTLLLDETGKLLFVHKISNKFWYIKSYDPRTHLLEFVCRTLDQKEDFAILEDGSFLMASGSKLFHINAKKENIWKEIYDFEDWGIKNITRLKVFENQLAFVTTSAN